jgi:murein DD-endopeptidase MepM/ murein hydrolase activator NlpD
MALLVFRPSRSRLLVIALAALAVSACASTRTRPTPAPTVASGDYFNAPVFQGDTLASFSARYGLQPNDIIAANRVRQRKSNKHLLNNQLKVPAIERARVAPAIPAAAQAAVQPAVLPAQPAMNAPPVAARRASIESRSLAPLSVNSARNAGTSANGLDAPKSTAAPPAIVASLPPAPPAAAPSWFDWMTPATPPADAFDDELHFLWPVEGRVISPFGDNPNGGRNDGINILVPRGTPVRAADAGEVSYVGNELKGYGNLILIQHDNGFVTAYAHTDGVQVKRGEHVERGQVIATVGDTGNVSQPQLHFELRHGTQPVDPAPYLVEQTKQASGSSSKRLAEGTR